MLRGRISSYGMHAGSLESSKEATIALLSALQTSQVQHIAEKIAFLLINCKILITRSTEKQTLLFAGYKHATIVKFERKFFF